MNSARRFLRRLARRGASRPGGARWTDTEPQPPDCPPDWVTGPPDFVGVGAQKAGTTWWFHLITAHPAVHQDPRQRPELHFWDRFSHSRPTADDIARYHRLFARPPGVKAGEKTPDYMAYYWAPAMLKQAAPDARIIVLLRDPIERYLSARAHGAEAGWLLDKTNEAILFERGLYTSQVRRLHEVFGRQQVLVLQYEQCVRDPAALIARTYDFLGLDPHVPGDDVVRKGRNVARAAKVTLDDARLGAMRDAYAPDVRTLVAEVSDLDLGLWPNFRGVA